MENIVETKPCNACEGSGDEDEVDYGCPYCNGSGRVEVKEVENKK